MLDLIAQLVDKSLVVVDERGGEARYRLLEKVRQYALEKLVEAGEAGPVRRRHRDWFLKLAERAEPELVLGPRHAAWLDRLELEHDNLRAALEWSLTETRQKRCCGSWERCGAFGRSGGISPRAATG